ncbi:hypothetical protein F4819DRAFT_474058 [Hypoxylon fuscum]|nr:hypothetical protein F4819DRAFT_474058 [Hypoxylon fuscum]
MSGAGFETVASVLHLIFYHVLSNAEILQRLREGLNDIKVQYSNTIKLRMLEKLP